MATFKNFLLLAALGFIAGILVAMVIAPAFLAWYNTPGGAGQALCNCMELVRTTSDSLVRTQLIGGGIGTVFFLVAGLFWPRRTKPREAAVVAPATPVPTSPSPAVPDKATPKSSS